jgi:hypothetical protein
VAFGETYSLFGYSFGQGADDDSFRKRGIDFFLEPQAHMLLDFSAQSNAVINVDFRGGAGVRGRGWPSDRFSWRLRGFHECTHLGDEFVLDAAKADALFADDKIQYGKNYVQRDSLLRPFQRYNVSSEAIDLFVAVDAGDPWKLQPMVGGCAQLDGCDNPTEKYLKNLDGENNYVRGYMGIRFLTDGEYPPYLRYAPEIVAKHSAINNSLLSKTWELQYGFEYFNELDRGTSSTSLYNPNLYIHVISAALHCVPLLGIVIPELDNARYGVIAADHYWRSLYVDEDPGYTLAGNYVVGLIWGEYFRANSGQRAFSLLANWYLHDGPNPHGQFRNDTLDYEKFNRFLPEIRFEINIGL